MKKNRIKIVTILLLIVLICLISFVGIYVKKQNHMENIVKDYQFGMNLEGSRVITLDVNTEKKEVIKDKDGKVIEDATEEDVEKNGYTKEEVPYNADDVLTIENYNKTKSILEERLKGFMVQDYIIKLNNETGKIIIEIPENEGTDNVVSNINQVGKFQIVSDETDEILIDNQHIKDSAVMYQDTETGTVVFLQINFTEEGKEKLDQISREYVSSTDEDGNDTGKTVSLKLDDSVMMSTSFDEPMPNGILQLSMGQASTDTDKINETAENANTISIILNTGTLPVNYQIGGNEFIKSDITTEMLLVVTAIVAGLTLISLIILIFKYKMLGLLSSFSHIGCIALFLLLLRYTNVEITIEGIAAIIVVIILNYVFNQNVLEKIKEYNGDKIEKVNTSNAIKDSFKNFLIKMIPVAIISIVFCFIQWAPISTFGMTIFWGFVLIVFYNMIITKTLLELRAGK